jgi:tetratricopeptide (TPR) repeat protein
MEVTMANRIRIAALTGAALLAVSNPQIAAWAAGGGGGGGGAMPSDSAPQYDAAAEYRNGIAALEQERWKDAERAFARVLAAAPRDANTNYLMALSKLGRNDFKGGRGFLEKAIKYDPNLLAAHVKLGLTQARLGDPAKAQTELDWLNARASACASTCADAAKITQGIAEVTAAMAAGKQAGLAPPDLRAYAPVAPGDQAYLAAVALLNEHRYAEAIAELEQAQLRFGPHPDVLTYLGFANRKLKRFDRAEDYYRAALAVAPTHLGAIEYYGEMMLERGDRTGAQAMLARLDALCTFGCAQSDELRRWIDQGSSQG